jgi:ribosomal protein S27AE
MVERHCQGQEPRCPKCGNSRWIAERNPETGRWVTQPCSCVPKKPTRPEDGQESQQT